MFVPPAHSSSSPVNQNAPIEPTLASIPTDILRLILQSLDFLGLYSTPLVCQSWNKIYHLPEVKPIFQQLRKEQVQLLKAQLQKDYKLHQWVLPSFVNEFAKNRLVRHGPLAQFLFRKSDPCETLLPAALPPVPAPTPFSELGYTGENYGYFLSHTGIDGDCYSITQFDRLKNEKIQEIKTNLFTIPDNTKLLSFKYVLGHIIFTYPISCARPQSSGSSSSASKACDNATELCMEIIKIEETLISYQIRIKIPKFAKLISIDNDQFYFEYSDTNNEEYQKILVFNKQKSEFKEVQQGGKIFISEEHIFICVPNKKNIYIFDKNLNGSSRITISGKLKLYDAAQLQLFEHEHCLIVWHPEQSHCGIWDIQSRKRIHEGDADTFRRIIEAIEINTQDNKPCIIS